MPDSTKLWMQSSLNRLALNRALEMIEQTGRALPCSVIAVEGTIVRVKFEVTNTPFTLPPLTIAKAESQWLRTPTQVGDLGMTLPADTYLGGVTALGGGAADLTTDYGNLTALVFVPVTNANWTAAPDPNMPWINGPSGVYLSDTARTTTLVIDADPSIASTVTTGTGAAQKVVSTTLDGAAQKITHEITSLANGTISTLMDGAGKAISHIVPTGGGVGLGAEFSTLSSANAAYNETHITSLMTNNQQARIQDISTIAAAMVTAGVPNAGAVATALLAMASPPSALGIAAGVVPLPTIPAGAAKVRLPT